jgi:hypothetical protein
MSDLNELIRYLEGQMALTKQNLDNPVDSCHFPSPDYWNGYNRALVDTRGWALAILREVEQSDNGLYPIADDDPINQPPNRITYLT